MNSNIVWINTDDDWKRGELICETDSGKYLILMDGDEIIIDNYEKHNSIENLKKNNLVDIPHLNEPSILEAIHIRYNSDTIYTYTGKILISLNPFKNLHLFTDKVIEEYKKNSKYLDPHLYQIADLAYKNLLNYSKNQTILVSGESGAGKTYSTRCIIKYLTCLSKNKSTIENMVVQSNPILEAFGNAKTSRNDNSSRFGKFIKIQTRNRGIVGCNIDTYLLEKIRVIQQEQGERNFHIFYQFLSSEKKKKYSLKDCSDYKFLNNTYIQCKDTDDSNEFKKLLDAFKTMNFNEKNVDDILKFIGCVLNIGNIKVNSDSVIEKDEAFIQTCKLLNVSEKKFIENVSTRIMRTNNEVIKINLERKDIKKTLNSLAMKIYDNVFEFIVRYINCQLKCNCESFIGILDIFGFESFKNNYFEQFCINYTNERLQEQFNNYIFKLEQKEYESEGIDWKNITFPDNKKCLELIEGKYGILKILDEECKLSRGSDQGFTNKIFKKYDTNPYLIKNKKFAQERFIVSHYAGNVEYNTTGFRQKNLDHVSESIVELLNLHPITRTNVVVSSNIKAKSVGIQFKSQLQLLMKEIDQTTPYYIRCIKPNDKNVPDLFDRTRVNSQIKYSGVLSAIQVSRAGYPVRFLKKNFKRRYSIIKKFKDDASFFLSNNLDSQTFEMGNTKIFLKNGAYDFLEDSRNMAIYENVLMIQKEWRRFKTQRDYKYILCKIIQIQCFVRRIFAIRKWIFLKRTKACICLQKNVRKMILLKRYKNVLLNVRNIQLWYKRCVLNYKLKCVVKIQKFYRNQKQRVLLKTKVIQKRRWELMAEHWKKQEKERLRRNQEIADELRKQQEITMMNLQKEKDELDARIKKEEMERKKRENEINMEKLRIEREKKKLQEANILFKNSIQRDVDAKMKMASDMEKLMLENRRMQIQMKRMAQMQNEKSCIIN